MRRLRVIDIELFTDWTPSSFALRVRFVFGVSSMMPTPIHVSISGSFCSGIASSGSVDSTRAGAGVVTCTVTGASVPPETSIVIPDSAISSIEGAQIPS